MDAIGQPILSGGIELLLWFAIFRTIQSPTLGGFPLESYLSYALWASFMSRVCSNWMYEFRMIQEIETGTLNSLLVRPVSFFESYLSQFMGYKLTTALLSWWVPILVVTAFDLPMLWHRLPKVLLTMSLYLIFLHTISFIIATLAFHLTRVSSFTVAKNLMFWVLSGELIPLDLVPDPYKQVLLNLPFANAVYIPVAYMTGRVTDEVWLGGIFSIFWGTAFFGLIAAWAWRKGIANYVGTGA